VDPEFLTAHYLRFVVKDRPGVLAALATILASHNINIDAVLQQKAQSKDANAFVVTIEPCPPAILATALAEISRLDFHVAPTVDLPILSDGSGA
jgi:homoserine dehydrogenase